MTTKVTVDAHAGWPVTVIEKHEGKEPVYRTVPAGTVRDFHVHGTLKIEIIENTHDFVSPHHNLKPQA
ncbi:MAG: hypothetical protein C0421_05635 [Hyphomonas sp.]|uniref:hypothetical protein n=1 Tax=Hyphomonas sp. TaxID=87 RepID=UPI0025BC0284|nr:hypothetical protein [Hyphomonas sp.]MBA4338308.1 hypothetical protein [Hyphomonas sp.]